MLERLSGPTPSHFADASASSASQGAEDRGERDVIAATPTLAAPMRPVRSTWSAAALLDGPLALPLAIAFLVRALIAIAFAGTSPLGDERQYIAIGRTWAETGQFTGPWAPGYPAFLAGCHALFGGHAVEAARALQVLLGTATGFGVAWLAGLCAGTRAARAAAWIWALYLPIAGYCALLFSETLYLALLVPALGLVLSASDTRRGALALLGTGALLGLTVLVREGGLLLLLPILLFVAVRERSPRSATWIGVGVALVLAPWIAHNAQMPGERGLIGNTAGSNAYLAWNAHDINFDLAGLPDDVTTGDLRSAIRGPAPEAWEHRTQPGGGRSASNAITDGLSFLAAHPGFAIRARLVEWIDLWSPTNYTVRQLRTTDGFGAPLGTALARRTFALLSVLAMPLLCLLALLGASGRRSADSGIRGLALAVGAGTAAVVLLNAVTRFRLPAIPVLVVLAAVWIASPRGERSRRANIGVALGVLVCLATWWPSLPSVAASLSAID